MFNDFANKARVYINDFITPNSYVAEGQFPFVIFLNGL